MMVSEGAGSDPCDGLLPPRKRLLAGLKKQSSEIASSLPPLPLISSELAAHFRHLFNNLGNLTPEDIVEAFRSAALPAIGVAAAAKATAIEKATVAVKAKVFARSALELVVPTMGSDTCGEDNLMRNKNKKKHVPVELLYRTNCPVASSETDEELARRLHRAMNSSPSLSRKSGKKHVILGKMKDSGGDSLCGHNSTPFYEGGVQSRDESCVDKVEEKALMFSKADHLGKEAEAGDPSEKYQLKFKAESVGSVKRGRSKQKKLPLSQCCMRDIKDSRELPPSEVHSMIAERKSDDTVEDMASYAQKPANVYHRSLDLEATSVWKCKKIKASQCYSENKALHPLCSIPAVTTASPLVKVD